MAKRKRPSRATGVGRGTGPGSRSTQFQPDEPSRNPLGRPKRTEQPVSLDLRALIREALAESVSVTENGVTQHIPKLKAFVKVMMNGFPNANARDQAMFFRFLLKDVLPGADEERDRTIPHDALAAFLDGLMDEKNEAEQRNLNS